MLRAKREKTLEWRSTFLGWWRRERGAKSCFICTGSSVFKSAHWQFMKSSDNGTTTKAALSTLNERIPTETENCRRTRHFSTKWKFLNAVLQCSVLCVVLCVVMYWWVKNQGSRLVSVTSAIFPTHLAGRRRQKSHPHVGHGRLLVSATMTGESSGSSRRGKLGDLSQQQLLYLRSSKALPYSFFFTQADWPLIPHGNMTRIASTFPFSPFPVRRRSRQREINNRENNDADDDGATTALIEVLPLVLLRICRLDLVVRCTRPKVVNFYNDFAVGFKNSSRKFWVLKQSVRA